jgi:acyl-CoA-dependent ceramide synthase
MARHVMYLKLCYDIWVDVPGPRTMLFGCYNGATSELIPDMPAQPDKFAHLLWPFQNLDGVICLNQQVKYIFLGMLLSLQTLSIIWFGMILKVIAGMLMGVKVEDVRSDDEGEVEVEENGGEVTERRQMNVTDLNICVGGGEETGVGRPEKLISSPKPRVSSITSGRRRLGGAENRKELLSRIGCEKPID